MKPKAFAKVATLSLTVAVSMVGCTGAAYKTSPAFAGATFGKTHNFAADAEQALGTKKYSIALTQAEAAVAAQPDSGAYRALLGRAYLANGRFVSAEAAFRDAMTLGSVEPRIIVSLALIRVAQGDSAGARTLLVNEMDRIPAADYGLAMAMAGDAPEGIRILSEAIHDPSANAKTRQNLAYAYALDGRWRDARMMAEQDIDSTVAGQRVLAWAQMSEPGAEAVRVAALMGINPRADDTGLPVRLALAPVSPAVQTAQTQAPAVVSAPVEVASADIAPAPTLAPAMVQVVPAPSVSTFKPVTSRSIRAVAEQPSRTYLRRAAYIRPVTGNSASPWVVQLGAYDSASVAKEKWTRMARYNTALGAFPVVNSTATVDGRFFYRLAVSGFGDRGAADQMCRSLRENGGKCFVRQDGPVVMPDRWVAAKIKGKQIAMR